MAALGEYITTLANSHAPSDNDSFYSIALQISTHEALQGHNILAEDINRAVNLSRKNRSNIIQLPGVLGDF